MPTYTIEDDTCCILLSVGGVNRLDLPKDETVLRIVLAGEVGNESGVDEVWLVYEGKHTWEIPWNDVTVDGNTPSNVEDLRTEILALLNAGGCVITPVEILPNVGFGSNVPDGGGTFNPMAGWQYINVNQGGGAQIQYGPSRIDFDCPGADDFSTVDCYLGITVNDGVDNFLIDSTLDLTFSFDYNRYDARSGSEIYVALYDVNAGVYWAKDYAASDYGTITETILPGNWNPGFPPHGLPSAGYPPGTDLAICFATQIQDFTGSHREDSFYIDSVSITHDVCI